MDLEGKKELPISALGPSRTTNALTYRRVRKELLVVSICLVLGLFGICCPVSLDVVVVKSECLTLLVDLTALSIGALRVASVSGVHLASRVGLCSIYLLL